MPKRTSITLPIRDAELIHAALVDAGGAKLRSMADMGLSGTLTGLGGIELQLANQLQERIKEVRARNREIELSEGSQRLAEVSHSPVR